KIDSCGLEPGSDLTTEDFRSAPRSEEEQAFTTPSDLALRIYPNPFQGQFTLELDLEQPVPVSIELYSLTGGRVSTLLSGEQLPAGTQRLTIDGSRLPAGIYMLSVTANGERTARRVVRMQ
ncbi:MAG: T9SS type A sorting domain-containing protein, partial [Saprospiraceae bacterium]